jgi:hypothetical protein
MKCVIHVGMHKTGSTSIQNVLASNQFDEFDYLNLDVPNHSVALYTMFSGDSKGHHLLRHRGLDDAGVSSYREAMFKRLGQQLENCKKTLVISGEVLSSPDSRNILIAVRKFLAPYFAEIKVIGYVRPPVTFTQSDFQEGIKGGAGKFNVHQKFPKYKERFEKLDSTFGRENVELVKFSKETLYQQDVVRDFLSRMGLKNPQLTSGRANESLSLEVVSVLYAFQKSRLESGGASLSPHQRNALIEALRPIGSNKVIFGKQLVEELLGDYREEVQWMEARLGCGLHEQFQRGISINSEADLLNIAKKQVPRLLDLLKTRYDQRTEISVPTIMNEILPGLVEGMPNSRISDLTLGVIAQKFGLELHVLHRELGKLLVARGNRTAAKKVLDEGLIIHPQGEGLRRLRDDIEKQ